MIGQKLFDILTMHQIECVTTGPNVKKGNFCIRCPWCADDPSQHLGIHFESGVYSCWRSPQHKGGNASYILIATLGWSHDRAWRALHDDTPEIHEGELERVAGGNFFDNSAPVIIRGSTHFRQDLKSKYRLVKIESYNLTNKFHSYILQRGFGRSTSTVIAYYDLHCALSGDFRNRVIIPLKSKAGNWLTFTGRSIFKTADLRYRALSAEESAAPLDQTLFNFGHVAQGGDTLVVTEGPFDAMKIDWVGKRLGVRAVALCRVVVSDEQLLLLNGLKRNYKRIVFVFDKEFEDMAAATAIRFGGTVMCTPRGIHDLGDMTMRGVFKFAKEVSSGSN